MISSRIERDREELCRRMGLERRKRVSECVRAMSDLRTSIRRAHDRAILANNARVANWMQRFEAARQR